MISASEAREQINHDNNRMKALEKCKAWTEKSIKTAISRGENHCCLAYTSLNIDGKEYNVNFEIREWLRDLGYTFRPTGEIGGVWQKSEEICW